MGSTGLLTDVASGVLTISLNRPEHRNAIDPKLRDLLAHALESAAMFPEVQAVVITGEGGASCASGDLVPYREGRLGMVATHGGCARLVTLLGLARARDDARDARR